MLVRLDRGAGNFYLLKIPKCRVDNINSIHGESLKVKVDGGVHSNFLVQQSNAYHNNIPVIAPNR